MEAFSEMRRVCKPDGMIVVCDAYTSDDPAKAGAFNKMKRLRDPSTVRFHRLDELERIFEQASHTPSQHFYRVPFEMNTLLKASFPNEGDASPVRDMIEQSFKDDSLGAGTRVADGYIIFHYSVVILAAKNQSGG